MIHARTRPARIRWLVLAAVAALSLTLTSPVAGADEPLADEVTAWCRGSVYVWNVDPLEAVPASIEWWLAGRCMGYAHLDYGDTWREVNDIWSIDAYGRGFGTCESFEASGQGTWDWGWGSSSGLENIAIQHKTGALWMQFDMNWPEGSGDLVAATPGVCSESSWSGDSSFQFDGFFTLAKEDVEEMAGLVDLEDPSFASDGCELARGDRVVENTVLGVRQAVWVHQPSTDELWVCARVEDDTGEGYGGRLEITPTGLDPQVTGGVAEPEVDSASAECTNASGNDAPGTRPIAFGGVGPVDYMLDAYLDDDEAWLCLQVGSTDTRVVVPLGGDTPEVSFGSVATWWPDEGTPTL